MCLPREALHRLHRRKIVIIDRFCYCLPLHLCCSSPLQRRGDISLMYLYVKQPIIMKYYIWGNIAKSEPLNRQQPRKFRVTISNKTKRTLIACFYGGWYFILCDTVACGLWLADSMWSPIAPATCICLLNKNKAQVAIVKEFGIMRASFRLSLRRIYTAQANTVIRSYSLFVHSECGRAEFSDIRE